MTAMITSALRASTPVSRPSATFSLSPSSLLKPKMRTAPASAPRASRPIPNPQPGQMGPTLAGSMKPDAMAFDTPSQSFAIPWRMKRNGAAPSPVARQVMAAAAVTVQTLTSTTQASNSPVGSTSGASRESAVVTLESRLRRNYGASVGFQLGRGDVRCLTLDCACEFDSRTDADLAKDVAEMRLDGLLAEEELSRDLGIRLSVDHEVCDLELAFGQRGDWCPVVVAGARASVRAAAEFPEFAVCGLPVANRAAFFERD